MSNTLSVYDPLYYANEAIILLRKALGFAGRVYRGYEKDPQKKGSTISIRVPSVFTAQDAPSTKQSIAASEVQIKLDQWKEVKFALSDKELTYTGDQIIAEHIEPAAYALADNIDQALCATVKQFPWFYDVGSTAGVADLVGVRKILFENQVPMNDLHFMLDSDMEADLLSQSAFTQYTGAGDQGVQAQMRGSLGTKFGFELFANQNVTSHTKGTASTGTLAVNGAASAGAATINLDAGTVTGTLVPGDTFVIAGNTQRYSITNTTTAASNAFSNVTFTPALAAAAADDSVVTVSLDNHSECIGFHRRAIALAMAPLSEMGNNLGARIATVADPITNLALRSRVFYLPDSSEINVALDVLYGLKVLNPNMGCKARN